LTIQKPMIAFSAMRFKYFLVDLKSIQACTQ